MRCFIFILLFIALRANASTELTFQPDAACGKDAIVASLWPDNSYGTHADFIACAWTYQGNPSTTRALVEFDLATIPAGAQIISATLNLYHYNSPSNTGHSNLSGPATCWLERIVQPWNELSVTWNNQPSTTIQNRVYVMAPASNTQNYTLNVTALVADMINDPTNSFGFMLRQQTEQYYRSLLFASSDMSNPAFHPKLTVVYDLNQLPLNGCWTNVLISPDSTFPVPPANPVDPVVIIPNVFSPNADGINDVFFPDTIAAVIKEMQIYDRWGILVSESTPGMAWDGRSTSGMECTNGTYYFIIRYYSAMYGDAIETGFVTLLR